MVNPKRTDKNTLGEGRQRGLVLVMSCLFIRDICLRILSHNQTSFLKDVFIQLKGGVTERGGMAGTGPVRSQKPGDSSESSTWLQRFRHFGHHPLHCLAHQQGAARTETGVRMGCWSYTGCLPDMPQHCPHVVFFQDIHYSYLTAIMFSFRLVLQLGYNYPGKCRALDMIQPQFVSELCSDIIWL